MEWTTGRYQEGARLPRISAAGLAMRACGYEFAGFLALCFRCFLGAIAAVSCAVDGVAGVTAWVDGFAGIVGMALAFFPVSGLVCAIAGTALSIMATKQWLTGLAWVAPNSGG